jgi:hypothetical protein
MGKLIKLQDAVGTYNPESWIFNDYEGYRWEIPRSLNYADHALQW